jgi:hypothetical protein
VRAFPLRKRNGVPSVQHSFPIRISSPRRNAIDRRNHMQQLGLSAFCLTTADRSVFPNMAGAAYGFAGMGPYRGG